MKPIKNYTFTISKGMAGKVMEDDNLLDLDNPKFGRYWWSWKPSFTTNNGKFSKNECVDVGVTWLCFWFGFIFWPYKRNP